MLRIINIGLMLVCTAGFTHATVEARPGSFLVKRKAGISIMSAGAINAKANASTVQHFDSVEGLELVQVKLGGSPEKALEVYQNDPSIEYAEPNYIVHALGLPNDNYFKYQWGLNNVGQTAGTSDVDINAPAAWDSLTGSSNVVVGIIDTGVDYTHPDLVNNVWVDPNNGTRGYNAINGTYNPMDDNQHGTHVAGIIGAQGGNGLGVTGVMQKAKIIACKFLSADGSGDTAGALACMDYFVKLATRAQNPVKVVATNNSWGGGGYSQAFADAVKQHQKLGILFMAAASNESQNNDLVDAFPSNIRHSNVVSVAATDSKDALATFSNYGRRSVHVAAPGVDILSTIPGKRYAYLSGTSMATPFVTGLAGFLKAKDPSLDWISLKNLIIAGGVPTAAARSATISGRRIRMIDVNGRGSMSCSNQTVTERLLPKSSTVSLRVGQSLLISMLKINCAKSTQVPGAATGLINDLGQGPDDVAFDGVFNGYFTPTAAGSYVLAFPNSDNVTVNVTN